MNNIRPIQNLRTAFMMQDPKILWEQMPPAIKGDVERDALLRHYTTLSVGGPASFFANVQNADQALRFQNFALEHNLPCFVLGGGSNILADDAGYRGLVLHVGTTQFTVLGDTIKAGAGMSFDELIVTSLAQGLTGLEFASGIPGTLGGAIVGNAGCYGHEIGDFLIEAQILRRDGTLAVVGPEEFAFAYRSSDMRESGDVVLEVTLQLARGNTHAAGDVRLEKLLDREGKHPVNLPSAGSWFRNLPPATPGGRRQAAGELLEQAGAKDMQEGDAHVFPGHANMIVNMGAASCQDIQTLAGRMSKAVQDKFGVLLEAEVRFMSN
jgi:UDP-N-acetylmuramate dehydrogenase